MKAYLLHFIFICMSILIAVRSEYKADIIEKVGPVWYCDTICEGGCNGTAHFNFEDATCYCSIIDHIDDGDMDLIQNAASIIGMKIKFDGPKLKRSNDDEGDDSESTENINEKLSDNRKKMENILGIKPLQKLFPNLKVRQLVHSNDESDSVQNDHESLHNSNSGKGIFNNPILGQTAPRIKEFGSRQGTAVSPLFTQYGYKEHLTPALTRAMLMNVRDNLDYLLKRTEQTPYQPAVTAHETESLQNVLKQITQINVNMRPVTTTWGYFFNNLVHNLVPIVRQETPNTTLDDSTEGKEGEIVQSVTSSSMAIEAMTTPKSTTMPKITTSDVNSIHKISKHIEAKTKSGTKKPHQHALNHFHHAKIWKSSTVKTIPTTRSTTVTTPVYLPIEEGDSEIDDDENYGSYEYHE